jgi:hypothetical protein
LLLNDSYVIHMFVNCSWVDTRWQYTFTHKQYIEHHNEQQNNTNNKQNNTNNKFGRVLAVPSSCELYPGICLTTEGKARKNLGTNGLYLFILMCNTSVVCFRTPYLKESKWRSRYSDLPQPGRPDVRIPVGAEVFLFCGASIPTVGLTQPPIQFSVL